LGKWRLIFSSTIILLEFTCLLWSVRLLFPIKWPTALASRHLLPLPPTTHSLAYNNYYNYNNTILIIILYIIYYYYIIVIIIIILIIIIIYYYYYLPNGKGKLDEVIYIHLDSKTSFFIVGPGLVRQDLLCWESL